VSAPAAAAAALVAVVVAASEAVAAAEAAPEVVAEDVAGNMADRQLICEVCEQPFTYTEAEWTEDERQGFPAPRLCRSCTQQRNSVRAAKRASRPIRRRNFRR
jgi:hypothetical protein